MHSNAPLSPDETANEPAGILPWALVVIPLAAATLGVPCFIWLEAVVRL